MKILYILNTTKRVDTFSYTSMLAAQDLGLEFHIAGNWGYSSEVERLADEDEYGIRIYQIDLIRQPYSPGNWMAYQNLVSLIEAEQFDVIHCNTPTGGLLGRLAGKHCRLDKVIYQVHGFHFYPGAPFLNWLVYYPVERMLARYTDALITINRTDYHLAQQRVRPRRGGTVYYVPGVGIDLAAYSHLNLRKEEIRAEVRQQLGLSPTASMLLSVGEINQNKNHIVVLKAMAKLQDVSIHYYICGAGALEQKLKTFAQSNDLQDNIHFLGYRTDVKELLQACDLFLMPSYREGLSRSIMEAMASGLPCIVSDIRGNIDLIQNDIGGYVIGPRDHDGAAAAIERLTGDPSLRARMGRSNLQTIRAFGVPSIRSHMKQIYQEVLGV